MQLSWRGQGCLQCPGMSEVLLLQARARASMCLVRRAKMGLEPQLIVNDEGLEAGGREQAEGWGRQLLQL